MLNMYTLYLLGAQKNKKEDDFNVKLYPSSL